eukprot:15341066-Ditylum_brightwellii.AAC.1
MKKWRETSKTSQSLEGGKDNATTDRDKVPGKVIMTHLLNQDIQLLPGAIDVYMHEGNAFTWFHNGKHNSTFNLTPYANFRIQDGHKEGKCM